MNSTHKPVSVTLDERSIALLNAERRRTLAPRSAVVRAAIRAYLQDWMPMHAAPDGDDLILVVCASSGQISAARRGKDGWVDTEGHEVFPNAWRWPSVMKRRNAAELIREMRGDE